jgi:pimeloyl-ACP methyl ester carboxylesterase
MGDIRQRIRFCEAPDGARIAYSVIGRGPPLVMLSGGHCHLELDLESPVLGHWFAELSRRHALVRLDTRGFGLSDRSVSDHSIDAVARLFVQEAGTTPAKFVERARVRRAFHRVLGLSPREKAVSQWAIGAHRAQGGSVGLRHHA